MTTKEFVKTLSDKCLDDILCTEYHNEVWMDLESYRKDERPFKVVFREWAEETIARDFKVSELKENGWDY